MMSYVNLTDVEVNYKIALFKEMQDYKPPPTNWFVLGRALGKGCGNDVAYYLVWSFGVKGRVWTFNLEHIKLDVVYWVVEPLELVQQQKLLHIWLYNP